MSGAVRLKFSIAIIGGGIAGVSAAKQITQSCNAEIAMIDQHDIGSPSKSSAFTFTDAVREYRLEKAVLKYYSRVGLYSLMGSKVAYDLNSLQLAVIDYTTACKEILSSAQNSQIRVFSHTHAKNLRKDNGKILVNLEGASNSTLECDLLIDASGVSFFTASIFQFQIPHFFSHAYGYELDNCTIPDILLDELAFFMGRSTGSGGGWFYPFTRNRCRFGVAAVSSLPVFPEGMLRKRYDFAKRSLHPFSSMTQGSVPLIKQAGSIPAEPVKDLVVDHVMRVGDAAGHATPHMMEGVRPCIESGMLCGMIAAEAYKKGDFSKNLLRKYEKLWQNRHKMQYLYLLSEAEINFSQDDAKIEKSISSQAGKSHRMNPSTYLRGLGGNSRFPFFLLGRPSLQRLRILSRFVRHNVRWSLE